MKAEHVAMSGTSAYRGLHQILVARSDVSIEVRLLGQFEVRRAGRLLVLTSNKLRATIASLALFADDVVTVDTIATAVWGAHLPQNVTNTVQAYVARLRQVLGASAIETRPHGYVLRVDPEQVDVLRFLQQSSVSRGAADERIQLDAALHLWRGSPFEGIASTSLAQAEAPGLIERYLATLERRVDLDLAAGRPVDVVFRLREMAGRHPLREPLWARLIIALKQSGQPDEAVRCFETVRERIASELGVDPGPALQRIHADLLLMTHSQPTARRQMPPDTPHFTGRVDHLTTLDELILRGTPHEPVVIAALHGSAGTGKTTLAVHWAHRARDRFPDGQLFIDLGGFGPTPPLQPSAALESLLRDLGVHSTQMPQGLDARSAMLRSLLAGKRMLIVLDNARDSVQVRPLLPGSTCHVIITSRSQLRGLAARDGAHRLAIEELSPEESAALLATRLQNRSVSYAVEQLAELADLCGHLPLTLNIAADHASRHPRTSIAVIVQQLRTHQATAEALPADDAAFTTHTVFSWSYQALDPDTARCFRILSQHPGTDFEPMSASALIDAPARQTSELLDRLTDAHLLKEIGPGRYQYHDLLRAYARSLATADNERRTALDRLFDHYAHTTAAAIDLAYSHELTLVPHPETPVGGGVLIPRFENPSQAEAWLDAELDNLLLAAIHAPQFDRRDHTVHQSNSLHHHLQVRGRYTAATTLHRKALTAARSTSDPISELVALAGLAWIHRVHGRYRSAARAYRRVLRISHATGYRIGELQALIDVAYVYRLQGHYSAADNVLQQALKLAGETGNRSGEMNALIGLGRLHHLQGQYKEGGDAYAEALKVAREVDHRIGKLTALTGLGWVYRAQGRYRLAIDAFEHALTIARASGHPDGVRNALLGLGTAHHAERRYGDAATVIAQALTIARTTGHRSGEVAALVDFGNVRRAQGRHDEATDLFQQALRTARLIGGRNSEMEVLYALGRVHHAIGDYDQALTDHHHALDIAVKLGHSHDQARIHDGFADTYCALGLLEQARQHWHTALTILTNASLETTDDPEVTINRIRARIARL